MTDENPEGTNNSPAPSQADETAVWTPPPAPPAEAPQAAPYPPPPPPPPPPAPPAPFEPPPYSPPPASTPAQVPPAYQQQFGAPYAPYQPPAQQQPAARRGGGRTLLIIGIIAVVVLAALGGGGVIANASLSSTYSPQKAVSDYFSAMSKGDVTGVMSNATFLSGDSGFSELFGKSAVTAMLAINENKQVTNVHVGNVSTIDDSTRSVPVTLSWGGSPRTLTYKVQKDTSRVHFLLYPSWRVVVPFSTITIKVPNQGGAVDVDGVNLPDNSGSAQVIQGFHTVTMAVSNFYAAHVLTADAVDSTSSVTFPSDLSASAQSAAVDSVKGAFNNVTCDANKYFDCPNHAYKVPAGYYDVLPAAGGDIRANSSWSLAFEGDPTSAMKLVVSSTTGQVDASGTCGMKLTVDGSHVYHFTGTWSGTLTWSGNTNGNFSSDVTINCDDARA